MRPTNARLLISCPDRPGIVAAVAGFMHNHNANITALDQHSTAEEGGTLLMRLEFHTPYLDLTKTALEAAFAEVVAERFAMTWHMAYANERKRTAVLVSKQDHALLDLLWRWRRERLDTDITMVISNHDGLRAAVEAFGVSYHHVPNDPQRKPEAEAEMLELLKGQTDVVVLARYMQVLSGAFIRHFPNRIINIHHSFLPAFAGADPYRQAWHAGVKIVGATAHYVTDELDTGPIIEQDVVRVDHRYSVADLRELGRTLERDVLARAVRWHLEDRVLLHDQKTVVFI
jgi:formyltetrahydrofolate deformylase